MTNLTRREAVRQSLTLREAMDRLFDEAFLRPWTPEAWIAPSGGPAIDLCETPDEVIVTATLPGVKLEDIKIALVGEILQISAEQRQETERKDATYHLRERRYGSFSRSIPLPAPVAADRVNAEFENGVLTVTMPRAEQARPKTINVKAKK